MSRGATTRRGFLGGAGLGVGALVLAGCGGGASSAGAAGTGSPAASGSTRETTWIDPTGDGQLVVGPGEPLVDRVELGPVARASGVLATFAHVTDAHVLDASSPARVTFLDRLGPPFESTFRPQETLTTQVLAGTLAAVRALSPALVIQGGDLIDNVQNNELTHALAVLGGEVVSPGSGSHGYYGVQLEWDPDPFYYRPDVDAPRHIGLLRDAVRPFRSGGLGRIPWVPVFGDHDGLAAGELVPNPVTKALAVGERALWALPADLSLPSGFRLGPTDSPDGPPDPTFVSSLLAQALAGPTVTVPPDPARYEMEVREAVARLIDARGSALARSGPFAAEKSTPFGLVPGSKLAVTPRLSGEPRLDYVLDAGDHVSLVVLDLARRDGGSGGLVVSGQAAWVDAQCAAAHSAGRWVIFVSHQALWDSTGGAEVLAVLDRSPAVIATLSGHTHRSRIRPRETALGGYWLIETASLIDFPQQARALRVLSLEGGGVAIETWMLDHVAPGTLGRISRELSYLDAQGGRPQGFSGGRRDRNVVLYRRG